MTRTEERDETYDVLRELPVEVSVEQVGAFVATITLAPTAAFWLSKINLNTILMTSAGASIIAGSMYLLTPSVADRPAAVQVVPVAPSMETLRSEPEPEPLAAVPLRMPEQHEVAVAPVKSEIAPIAPVESVAPVNEIPLTASVEPIPPAPPDRSITFVPLRPGMAVVGNCELAVPMDAMGNSSRVFDLTGFSKVASHGSMDVVVEQGPFSVKAEGDADLLERITVVVTDHALTISGPSSGYDCSEKKSITVHVRMPALEGVSLNGSGNVVVEDFTCSGSFKLTLHGSGDVHTTSLKGLAALGVDLTGSGDIEFEETDVSGKTTIDATGSGDVRIAGRTGTLDVELRGSGDVAASELKTGACDVLVYGSGDVDVNCTGSMRARTFGSGEVNNNGSAGGSGTSTGGLQSN